jgi:hypothetical protein
MWLAFNPQPLFNKKPPPLSEGFFFNLDHDLISYSSWRSLSLTFLFLSERQVGEFLSQPFWLSLRLFLLLPLSLSVKVLVEQRYA